MVVASAVAVAAWRGALEGATAGPLLWVAATLGASPVDAAELVAAGLPESCVDPGWDDGEFAAGLAVALAVRVGGMAANASLGGVAFGAAA
ncbi:MAG: hypothetical protein JWR07_5053 [Nevskia sp.]|nr:hypothetical protein [Nevskia sp.]